MKSFHLPAARFSYSIGRTNTASVAAVVNVNIASDSEHALECKVCKINNYPRISPCIIVLVTRGDHCLLARNSELAGQSF